MEILKTTYTNLITIDECRLIVKKYLNDHIIPLTVTNYSLVKFNAKVIGYLGEHFKLEIQYEINDESGKNQVHSETVSFFVKTLPFSNQSHCEYVLSMNIFDKECSIYENILETLQKYVETTFMAKYMHSSPGRFLVLENLQNADFSMATSSYLTKIQCYALLKSLAAFHASSLIFEEKQGGGRLNKLFPKEVEERTFSFQKGHVRQKWCMCVTNCVKNCIKLLSAIDSNEADDLCRKFEEIVGQHIPKLIQPSSRFRNVLIHDDLHNNNILFSRDNTKCVFVDFQLTRYVPPAMDVLLALYLNFHPEFLRHNISMLLECYYKCVTKELAKHNLKIDTILPKDEFEESVKLYELGARVEAVMYGTTVYLSDQLSSEIMADNEIFKEFTFINRSKFITKEYKENAKFQDRFNSVLLPFVDYLRNFPN